MELRNLFGGAVLDFTLPALGGGVPDEYGCTCAVGTAGCSGESSCKDDAGERCPENYSTCTDDACTDDMLKHSGSCRGVATCGGGTCHNNRG